MIIGSVVAFGLAAVHLRISCTATGSELLMPAPPPAGLRIAATVPPDSDTPISGGSVLSDRPWLVALVVVGTQLAFPLTCLIDQKRFAVII